MGWGWAWRPGWVWWWAWRPGRMGRRAWRPGWMGRTGLWWSWSFWWFVQRFIFLSLLPVLLLVVPRLLWWTWPIWRWTWPRRPTFLSSCIFNFYNVQAIIGFSILHFYFNCLFFSFYHHRTIVFDYRLSFYHLEWLK